MAVTIVLFEDNETLRESLVSLIQLNDGLRLAGAFENATRVVDQVRELKPDLVLMDIDMPGITGIDAVKQLRKERIAVPVLMLTVFDDNNNVFQAIRAGASGYLLKKHISTRLFESIDDALNGGAPMSPAVARMVIASMHEGHNNPYDLTAREREILSSLSQGNSYKLIAAALGITLETVRTHIKRIYEKLHVHSQAEAVSKAIHERLV